MSTYKDITNTSDGFTSIKLEITIDNKSDLIELIGRLNMSDNAIKETLLNDFKESAHLFKRKKHNTLFFKLFTYLEENYLKLLK